MTQATDATGPGRDTSASAGEARTPAEIERDIEATRSRLAGTIDQIGERVSPATVVQRVKDTARAQVVDENGVVRTTRVLAAGGAVAGVVVLKLVAALRSRRTR